MKSSYKRLTQPLIRRNGALAPAGWDEALDARGRGLPQGRRPGRPVVRSLQLLQGHQRDELPGSEVRPQVMGSHNVDSCNRT